MKMRENLLELAGIEIRPTDICIEQLSLTMFVDRGNDHAAKFKIIMLNDDLLSVLIYKRDPEILSKFIDLDTFEWICEHRVPEAYTCFHAPKTLDTTLIVGALFRFAIERYYL
jgi:hypothetical protein